MATDHSESTQAAPCALAPRNTPARLPPPEAECCSLRAAGGGVPGPQPTSRVTRQRVHDVHPVVVRKLHLVEHAIHFKGQGPSPVDTEPDPVLTPELIPRREQLDQVRACHLESRVTQFPQTRLGFMRVSESARSRLRSICPIASVVACAGPADGSPHADPLTCSPELMPDSPESALLPQAGNCTAPTAKMSGSVSRRERANSDDDAAQGGNERRGRLESFCASHEILMQLLQATIQYHQFLGTLPGLELIL